MTEEKQRAERMSELVETLERKLQVFKRQREDAVRNVDFVFITKLIGPFQETKPIIEFEMSFRNKWLL